MLHPVIFASHTQHMIWLNLMFLEHLSSEHGSSYAIDQIIIELKSKLKSTPKLTSRCPFDDTDFLFYK